MRLRTSLFVLGLSISGMLFHPLGFAENLVSFTPPKGWMLADEKSLPRNVKIMVVGKGAYNYPPSINLAVEKYEGSLQDYLRFIDTFNKKRGAEWKNLGKIQTEAGEASLSQVDARNVWGVERQMHVILMREGIVYILTVAALKDEFSSFYKDFFASMRSMKIDFGSPHTAIEQQSIR